MWIMSNQSSIKHILCPFRACMMVFNEITMLIELCHIFFQLSGTLTIPWWQWFLTRFGKKKAVYFGISVSKRCLFLAQQRHSLRGCVVHILLSLSIVGNTLYDPNHQHQEPPGHFLPGLSGSRCERGGGFPPAVVSIYLSTQPICRCGFLLIASWISI